MSPEAEAQALACAFACGHDFFDEVFDVLGVVEPIRAWPPETRPGAEKAWRAALQDAWRRVGRVYLDHNLGAGLAPNDRGEPWALEQFGEPELCR